MVSFSLNGQKVNILHPVGSYSPFLSQLTNSGSSVKTATDNMQINGYVSGPRQVFLKTGSSSHLACGPVCQPLQNLCGKKMISAVIILLTKVNISLLLCNLSFIPMSYHWNPGVKSTNFKSYAKPCFAIIVMNIIK